MHATTESWARKAEQDLATAGREREVTEDPNHEAVVSHAHACAERYLKARLQEMNVPFPETRHLVVLLHLCLEAEPDWSRFLDPMRALTHHGFRLNDPEAGIGAEEAEESLAFARVFRDQARASLGMD